MNISNRVRIPHSFLTNSSWFIQTADFFSQKVCVWKNFLSLPHHAHEGKRCKHTTERKRDNICGFRVEWRRRRRNCMVETMEDMRRNSKLHQVQIIWIQIEFFEAVMLGSIVRSERDEKKFYVCEACDEEELYETEKIDKMFGMIWNKFANSIFFYPPNSIGLPS
jgi:hypothetical protein